MAARGLRHRAAPRPPPRPPFVKTLYCRSTDAVFKARTRIYTAAGKVRRFSFIYNAAGFGFIITPTPSRVPPLEKYATMRPPPLLRPSPPTGRACSFLIKPDESRRARAAYVRAATPRYGQSRMTKGISQGFSDATNVAVSDFNYPLFPCFRTVNTAGRLL